MKMKRSLAALALVVVLGLFVFLRGSSVEDRVPHTPATQTTRHPAVTPRPSLPTVTTPAASPVQTTRIEGIVLDESDRPVQGALVRPVGVLTDESGIFTVQATAPVELRAFKDSFYTEPVVARGEGTVVLRLLSGTDVAVRVVANESGEPITGARVDVVEHGAYGVTDSSGIARFGGIGPDVGFVASAAGRKLNALRSTKPHSDVYVVRLSRSSMVNGVVLGPVGPVANAVVIAAGDRGLASGTAATTRSDGRFELEVVEGTTYKVSARAADMTHEEDVVVTTSSRDVVLKLHPKEPNQDETFVDIVGRVVDDERVPVAGVRVHASGRPVAITDDDGAFSAQVPGESPINVSVDGGAHALEASSGNVLEFTIARTTEVTGRVLIEGKPAPRFAVTLGSSSQHVSSRDGSFRVQLRAPKYPQDGWQSPTIVVSADSGADWRAPIKLVAGGAVDVGTIELVPVEWVSGRVVDANRRPVEGARVEMRSPRSSKRTTTTESDGSFRIARLERGRIIVTHDTDVVFVAANDVTNGVVVTLP
jgi:hypothetical protein